MSQLSIKSYDILKDGASFLTFTSFISFEPVTEAKTTNNPIEEGSFFSANKVVSPTTYKIVLGLTGTATELLRSLTLLQAELAEASLLQVVTPTQITPEATLTKLSYSDNIENGYGRLIVDLTLEEIKQVTAEYTQTDQTKPISTNNAKNASDSSNTDSGLQQTKKPSQSVLYKLTS